MEFWIIVVFAFFILTLVFWLSARLEIKKLRISLSNNRAELDRAFREKKDLEAKYSPIINVEAHAAKLKYDAEQAARSVRRAADDALSNANVLRYDASVVLKEAKAEAQSYKSKAREDATKIVEYAEQQAKEIAGAAYEAKAKADTYEAAIIAMRNTIDGYKDDYIVPNHSTLDDLAEEFGHKEAGEELKSIRKHIRSLVKDGHAGSCDYVEAHRKMYAIHFVVDAFNGKVASALSKVKHDNYGKIKQEIIDAFALVNHNGAPFRNARINQEYLDARLTELKWAVAVFELRNIEREEQAEIKAQIREEERALKEYEKARKEAEKEERIIQLALEQARNELSAANDEQKAEYEAKLLDLESKLKEAEEKGQRALSMAQQTRRGHVYVISNIGSFGENVFKIGMTRRLVPMDRVKELGDASVPFSFDVHAMIYHEDAPALEKELHRRFAAQSVNKINPRKEFFKTTIAEIKQVCSQQNISNVHWSLKAEAAEYRESLAIEKSQLAAPSVA